MKNNKHTTYELGMSILRQRIDPEKQKQVFSKTLEYIGRLERENVRLNRFIRENTNKKSGVDTFKVKNYIFYLQKALRDSEEQWSELNNKVLEVIADNKRLKETTEHFHYRDIEKSPIKG